MASEVKNDMLAAHKDVWKDATAWKTFVHTAEGVLALPGKEEKERNKLLECLLGLGKST